MTDEAVSFHRKEKNIKQFLFKVNPCKAPQNTWRTDISECLASSGTQISGQGNDLPKLYSSKLHSLDFQIRPWHFWVGFSININGEFCYHQWLGPTIPLTTTRKPTQNNAYLNASESYQGKENLQDQGLAQPGEVTPENGAPFLFSSTVDSKTKAELESRAFWDSHRNRGK